MGMKKVPGSLIVYASDIKTGLSQGSKSVLAESLAKNIRTKGQTAAVLMKKVKADLGAKQTIHYQFGLEKDSNAVIVPEKPIKIFKIQEPLSKS